MTKDKIAELVVCAIMVYIAGVLFIYPGNAIKSLLMASFIAVGAAIFELGSTSTSKPIRLTYCAFYGLLAFCTGALITFYIMNRLGGIQTSYLLITTSLIVGVSLAIVAVAWEWRKFKTIDKESDKKVKG
jgi:hypothetical protein